MKKRGFFSFEINVFLITDVCFLGNGVNEDEGDGIRTKLKELSIWFKTFVEMERSGEGKKSEKTLILVFFLLLVKKKRWMLKFGNKGYKKS